jgi:hypothetical protein
MMSIKDALLLFDIGLMPDSNELKRRKKRKRIGEKEKVEDKRGERNIQLNNIKTNLDES